MSPTSTIYFITLGVMFGTIILVFGIRFLQASAVAGADAAHTEAYRKLASDAVTAPVLRDDLLSALMNLGYHRPLAEKAVDAALKAAGRDAGFEHTLKQALRELAK